MPHEFVALAGNDSSVSPIMVEIIKGAISSARNEMEILIRRTAMSPFMRETRDYYASFFDRRCRMLSGSNVALGGGKSSIECILDYYPVETMRQGDIYWYNDCYLSRGGVSHTMDMVFVAPVFCEGELVAFSDAWGHFCDIGGLMPGSMTLASTEIFHEGILVPPGRLYREGVLNEEVLRIFTRNSRFPEMMKGDIRAVMAACKLGEKRMIELFERFAKARVLACFESMIRQNEMALRKAFRERVPDGTYSFRDYADSDCVTDRPYSIKLTLTKSGDEVSLDLTESDDQAKGPINFVMDPSVPKFMYGMFLTASSDDPSLFLNYGFIDAIGEVKLRRGSILSPMFPAPLNIRMITWAVLDNCILGTLAQATAQHPT